MSDRYRFRVPHFKRDGSFDSFTYWGRMGRNEFRGPAQDNHTAQGPDCQCTGLRDKNGALIWEGDILEGSMMQTYLVSFRCCSYVGVHAPECRSEAEGECKSDYLSDLAPDCIIIGNIYENPEILEATHE